MNTMKIQVGNSEEVRAWTDGPGWLTIDQGEHEISMNLIQALALAEFINANRGAMLEAHKKHMQSARGK